LLSTPCKIDNNYKLFLPKNLVGLYSFRLSTRVPCKIFFNFYFLRG
jgi:hypothetical protein